MPRKAIHILAFIAALILSACFLFVSGRALYQDEQFDQNAHRSQATIEKYWTTYGSKGGVRYHARYHFNDEKGVTWTVSIEIAQATYLRLQEGEVVPLKYLVDDPGQSRIDWPLEDQWHWRQDEIMVLMALVFGTFGLWAFWAKARQSSY